MRYGERAEVCWEKTVQQERKGEIVRGHKHPAASEHCMTWRYLCLPALLRARQERLKYLPENMWCEKERFCSKLAMGFLDVCVGMIQKEHISLHFHSALCSSQNLAFQGHSIKNK